LISGKKRSASPAPSLEKILLERNRMKLARDHSSGSLSGSGVPTVGGGGGSSNVAQAHAHAEGGAARGRGFKSSPLVSPLELAAEEKELGRSERTGEKAKAKEEKD
jgi:hypothetical protein